MTTIIAVQGDSFAIAVCDSRVSDVDQQGYATQIATVRESSGKLAYVGKYILGAAGDLRAINLLHHAFTPPTPAPNLRGKKLDHFITARFIPSLRECFETNGYANPQRENSEHIAQHNSVILVVVNGTIYVIDGSYSWASDTSGMFAIGTGAQYALGALRTLETKNKLTVNAAKKMALKALAVASRYDPYTGPPFHTFVSGDEKPKP